MDAKRLPSRAHSSAFISALLLISLLSSLSGCSAWHATTPSSPITAAQLSLDPYATTLPVPADFTGFGIEAGNICQMVNLAATNPAFQQLFTNLGQGTLRVGGNTLENVHWSPGSGGTGTCSTTNSTFTQKTLDGFFAFARRVGWKVTWGLTLKTYDPSAYAAEGVYALASGGNSVLSLEFGNEPDLYGIPYSTFLAQWQAYYTALQSASRATQLPLSGPATAGPGWIPAYLRDESAKTRFVSAHYYIECVNHTPTITDLLSRASMADEVAKFAAIAQAARAKGLPYVVNEANNYCGGGMPGVSNTFASALWGVDFLFTALEQRAARVNIQGVPNDPNGNWPPHLNYYSPINNDGGTAPIYYAMLLFHYAAANGKVVPTRLRTSANVSAHSVLGSDGKLYVILINKNQSGSTTIEINTTATYHSARTLWLKAPAISSKHSVTLGGSQVGSDGRWSPSQLISMPVSGASSAITLPAGSAAVITYQ